MSKQDPTRSYAVREREAVMAFALSVALDPESSPEDVEAAQHVLSRPDVETMLSDVDTWRLAALRAIMAQDDADPLTARIRELVAPHS